MQGCSSGHDGPVLCLSSLWNYFGQLHHYFHFPDATSLLKIYLCFAHTLILHSFIFVDCLAVVREQREYLDYDQWKWVKLLGIGFRVWLCVHRRGVTVCPLKGCCCLLTQEVWLSAR